MARKKKERKVIAEANNIVNELEKLNCEVIGDIAEENIPFSISTGLLALDLIISDYHGLSSGVSEIYGPPGVGKSHLALSILSQAQKSGLNCFYFNMERGINKDLVGCFKDLDSTEVTWINPDNGQAALNGMEAILRGQPNSFIVLDSIPACVSAAQLDAKAEESTMAVIARLMSAFMPKAKILANKNKCHVLMINQVRDNLKSPIGGKQTPGGWAVKYNSDWRIELMLSYPSPKIEHKGNLIGQKVKAEIAKSRHGKPFQTAIFPLIYGKGFDIGLGLVELGLQFGFISRSGAWYQILDQEQKVQGELEAANLLNSDQQTRDKLVKSIKELFS